MNENIDDCYDRELDRQLGRVDPDTVLADPARLAELHHLGLFDSDPEERFDRFTRLAALTFDVPISLVSLLGSDRQSFKSHHGLALCDTPMSSSFCRYTIAMQDILVVRDARVHALFADNPLVTGDPYIVFYAGVPLRGPTGQAVGSLCLIDSKPRRLNERERRTLLELGRLVEDELVLNDALCKARTRYTKLLNRDPALPIATRTIAYNQLDLQLDRARQRQERVSIVYLAIENLPHFERAHGESLVQRAVAQWLMRLQQPQVNMLFRARLSDTDFLSALVDLPEGISEKEYCRHWLREVGCDVEIDGVSMVFQVSAGMSVFPEQGDKAATLVEKAKMAHSMGHSHARELTMFDDSIGRQFERETYMRTQFENALRERAVYFNWQPIFDNPDLNLVGFELLARWDDARHGTITPDEFIPVIDGDDRLRRELVLHALGVACEHIAQWQAAHPAFVPRVSINIPGAEFYRSDFCLMVEQTLKRYGVRGDRLTFELTERSLIADFPATAGAMRRLERLGVLFAMDDFGSGYSSIAYLTQLPLNLVKLDKSVVQHLEAGSRTLALMRDIVALARGQGLMTVAEGVENEAQLELVQSMGCEYTQGYLLGRPQPESAAGRLVASLVP